MPNNHTKIAIIGAGLAGLTITYRLQQKGYDIALYEARPRVGGRVHSVHIQNTQGGFSIAELGGQNINDGGIAEYILGLANELGIEVVNDHFDFASLYHDGTTFHDTRTVFSQIPSVEDLFEEIHRLSTTCKNMREVLDQLFRANSLLNRICSFVLNSYEGSPPERLSSYHNYKTLEMVVSWFHPSFATDYEDEPTRIFLKNGNATLPLKIAEQLNGHLHLDMPLKKVNKAGERISLTFTNGTVATCEQLIFAMPCSVFKDIDIDQQILESSTLENFKKVQYGSSAKILYPIGYGAIPHKAIITDKAVSFFNGDNCLTNLYFINDDGSSVLLDHDLPKFLPIVKSGYTDCALTNQPPVKPIDEQFTYYTCPVAKSWVGDAFAQGSYSGYGVHLNEALDERIHYKDIEFKKLFAPVNNQLFFVGEHATILPEIGTMEAAVESAERLAMLF